MGARNMASVSPSKKSNHKRQRKLLPTPIIFRANISLWHQAFNEIEDEVTSQTIKVKAQNLELLVEQIDEYELVPDKYAKNFQNLKKHLDNLVNQFHQDLSELDHLNEQLQILHQNSVCIDPDQEMKTSFTEKSLEKFFIFKQENYHNLFIKVDRQFDSLQKSIKNTRKHKERGKIPHWKDDNLL